MTKTRIDYLNMLFDALAGAVTLAGQTKGNVPGLPTKLWPLINQVDYQISEELKKQ